MKDQILENTNIPPWSFYAIRQYPDGHDATTVKIAEAMTTRGVTALPEGSIKRALQILRDMSAAEIETGSGYKRLLILALAREPLNAPLFRIARVEISKQFDSGLVDEAFELYEAIPPKTQKKISNDLATPILRQAVQLFSSDDPSAPLTMAEPYRRLPQVEALARLPALCAETPEVLPNNNDAPMLRALLRQPEITSAVKSEVVDRLFERVGKGLPDDLGLSRLRLKRLRSANKVELARQISRQNARHPASQISDLANRFDILARLDRLDVIDRYMRWLERIHAAGGCENLDIASRLWAAGFSAKALAVLGPTEDFVNSAAHIEIALRAMLKLRRFGEAKALMTKAEDAGVRMHKSVAAQIDRAWTYLSSRGIQPAKGEDNSFGVVKDIIENVLDDPGCKYIPVPRRVLITTHSIAIGGAERQVTGQAVGLAKEADVESVMILANRDTEVTYDVPDIGGKLTVRCARSAQPGTTTLGVDGIDLGEVSANFGLAAMRRFYDEIIEFRPEVVHVRSGQHIEVALAALLAGTPRIVVHFGSMTRGQQSVGNDISKLREDLLEKGLAMATRAPNLKLVANSRSAANDWADAMGLERTEIGIITNCIDANAFSHPPALTEPKRDGLVVGGVFRFAPVKDPLMWVDIAAQVVRQRPNTRFFMVGDGPMRAAVEMSIDKLGLREHFTLPGLVTSGLSSWLAQMDVFLMTSRTESLPNSVIEAQLMGLPVVAPDVGGISEVFATPTSGKVCTRSVEALTDAVIAYLDNPALRAKTRDEAPRGIMQKFSSACQIADIRAAYGWPSAS